MKKSELKTMIRGIVREEVAMSIKEVIKEITQPTTKPKKKVVEKQEKYYSKNSVLNEVLNETAGDEDWKTMGGGTHTTDDMANIMAKSYGDLLNNKNNAKVDVNQMAIESNVNPETVPDHVEKALTRDYSKLVTAMKKSGMKQ